MSTLKLCIGGMRGPEDALRIEEGLRGLPGVLGVIARRRSECAEVEYEDDELSIERLLALVRELGYEAQLGG